MYALSMMSRDSSKRCASRRNRGVSCFDPYTQQAKNLDTHPNIDSPSERSPGQSVDDAMLVGPAILSPARSGARSTAYEPRPAPHHLFTVDELARHAQPLLQRDVRSQNSRLLFLVCDEQIADLVKPRVDAKSCRK